MLTLSWSDGNTLIPVNSCLLASAKDTNIIGPVKDFDNRTIAGKRRKLAQTKAPEAMMTLLDTAISAGLKADYVLFDSWFSNPAQITAIHSKDMDVIAMIKKSSRIKYSYCGEQLNIKEIYSRNKKRRGRSKYGVYRNDDDSLTDTVTISQNEAGIDTEDRIIKLKKYIANMK